jgi:hypothetical protein
MRFSFYDTGQWGLVIPETGFAGHCTKYTCSSANLMHLAAAD